ncbi:MAG: hypothetical protein K0Q59_2717, partial [Paenibacillus sp.]|nr:hypothetical protein [Paenibacillus sp.]
MKDCYTHVWEHYADELRLLDLKLKLLYVNRRSLAADPQIDSFRGMFVSDGEFMRMVGEGEEEGEPDGSAELVDRIGQLQRAITRRKAESGRRRVFLPIAYIARLFQLNEIEERIVMLGLAVELDRKYERIFGFLADDLTVRLPTVELALTLVCDSAEDRRASRLAFATDGKLVRYLLAEEDGEPFGRPLLSRPVALDRRITAFMLDTGSLAAELETFLTIHYPDEPLPPLLVHKRQQERLSAAFQVNDQLMQGDQRTPVGIHLHGATGSGKRLQLRHACAARGQNVLFADTKQLMSDPERFRGRLIQIVR